ncbi:MAG: hypothetical protein AVDCRST_MAG93-1646 [uncultured Chloroflexia bacterium]|uniref:Type I restriction enzyme R protein N-terminal domain-containing protein n=1 Tax=uncultured Chloroflexia bacterium TaxID=1672391 RepID=A0A6J4ICV8_9CHLR|nr:MAG: hypothetical protein AVDCRST_MAG93-1646 [uncultured Chloroflexia bacterium]
MPKNRTTSDVVDEIYQAILATPKRQRRLLSKTFWGKFGVERRTKERVAEVREALKQRNLVLDLDESEFGTEAKNEWIVLSLLDPAPQQTTEPKRGPDRSRATTPPDSWFRMLQARKFESEREVEFYFIVPLLEQMGYEEDDFSIGHPVQMYEGVNKVNKEADLVLFDGAERSKENALLVVEAKKPTTRIREDAIGQARGYALWLVTPYYIVTNADEIQVYVFRGPIQPDVRLMEFKRDELREHWETLYGHINKAAVVDYKDRLKKALAESMQP